MTHSSTPPFDPAALEQALYWARLMTLEWQKTHPDAVQGEGQWAKQLADWITLSGYTDDTRTTRVMKRLRRVAPREYEVVFRAMIRGESFGEITQWLNERAERNEIPVPEGKDGKHYVERDAVALFLAGVEFARTYY